MDEDNEFPGNISNRFKKKWKSIKSIDTDRLTNRETLLSLARFVAVLAIASLFLTYLYSLNLEMSFSRRQAGQHTNAVMNTIGINSSFYSHSVRIPKSSPVKSSAALKLKRLGFKRVGNGKTIDFLAKDLSPSHEKTVRTYLENLREEGHLIYTSPSTILVPRGENASFQVDIIPACVGWVGLFAVIALIIAYPYANIEERFLGAILAVPFVYLMNIVRLSTTIYAGWKYGVPFLRVVHGILWKTLLVIWALFLWIMWIKYIVKGGSSKDSEEKGKSENSE